MKYLGIPLLLFTIVLSSCSKDEETATEACISTQQIDQSRGECSEKLTDVSEYVEVINATSRVITTNSIPGHTVGLFGNVPGSLNPNAIKAQASVYEITTTPAVAATITRLLSTTGPGPQAGPQFSFGILFNGVELDPVAAEPWPHTKPPTSPPNWEWNLEATYVRIGLDCNSAHVQPTGKYHYHGPPTPFLESLGFTSDKMTMVGYAADGFPIYYKYGYTLADDSLSGVIALSSSYKLKSGYRPGDGITAPCDVYTGVYSNDWEYVNGWGVLDECNGRTGVTPEYPSGTYYYVLTDEFPSIPRCFKGTPSQDFKLGM